MCGFSDLDVGGISTCLEAHSGLRAASVTFLPVGYDPDAAVYKVVSHEALTYFLKVRRDPTNESSLLVPRALGDFGIDGVIPPLRTRSSDLWRPLDDHADYGLVLYPFVSGENAMASGLSDDQWRRFGSALRAVHDGGYAERFRNLLPVETFMLPSAALARRILELAGETYSEGWPRRVWRRSCVSVKGRSAG